MAPPQRATSRAGSSRSGATARPATNGKAGPSRPVASASSSGSKKRQVQQVEQEDEQEDEDDLVADGATLDLEMDEDDDADIEEDEAEDEEEDVFPELDSGSEGDLEDEAGDSDQDSGDEELLDDELTGSESGYNSSDIEAMQDDDEDDDAPSSSTSAPPSPSSSSANLTTDEKLSRLIAKNSIKPNEQIGTDARISNAKQGHGQLVRSKLVDGGFKREYEDVEAGYGSESSTEDVSIGSHSCQDIVLEAWLNAIRTQTQ